MIFYVLALFMSGLAVAAVCTTKILRAAVYLMGVLTLSAGLYLLLGQEFLAGVQVLVYVGGIVALLVFAVMLTHTETLKHDSASFGRKFFAGWMAVNFFVSSVWVLSQSRLAQEFEMPALPSPSPFSIVNIGKAFLLPFELISVLLLAMLIARIVIARKEPTP